MNYQEPYRKLRIDYTLNKCTECKRLYVYSMSSDWTMSTYMEKWHCHYIKTEQKRRDKLLVEANPNKGMYIP